VAKTRFVGVYVGVVRDLPAMAAAVDSHANVLLEKNIIGL
jgi:hypothetical protein